MRRKILVPIIMMFTLSLAGCGKNSVQINPGVGDSTTKIQYEEDASVDMSVDVQSSSEIVVEEEAENPEIVLQTQHGDSETLSWEKLIKMKDDNKLQTVELTIENKDTKDKVVANIEVNYYEMAATCTCEYNVSVDGKVVNETVSYEASTDGIVKEVESSIPSENRAEFETMIDQAVYEAFH